MRKNYFAAGKSRFTCLLKSLLLLLCLGTTGAASSQCWFNNPPGDPNVYGSDYWIGYVYSGLDTNNPPQNAFSGGEYKGYLTQFDQFDYNPGTWPVSGFNICGSHSDSFSIRYRMQKNFAAGYYTFTLGGDDGVRLSVDGGATWVISDWNYHSYQQTSTTIYLSGLTNMVIESYDQGSYYRVNFSYTACTSYSTAPTAISGTTAICAGNSTTLTATGGTLASGSSYQWGTGTIGSNIIAGQTGASITVSPTANTTYWVRRVDPAPCNVVTTGIAQQVTVTQMSTAPTALSGGSTICLGSSATLTASGGTMAAGSVYEWGTGTVGSNIIVGHTTASITVSPASTTTYWVRRVNANSCGSTAAVTATVSVTVPAGDQISYGNNSWIGYVYTSIDSANPPTNAFTSTYRGYLTQPEVFDMNLGTGALFGTNICGTHPSHFAIRFKMNKVLTAGYYTFTVGGDDGYRFSIDGGNTWIASNWQDHGYTTSTTSQLYLSGSTNFVIEFYERGGDTRVTFNYTACTDVSTAPTAISGTTAICRGTSTTLTATGGYAGSLSTYQWGTGTIGTNIIGGQTSASITVSPNNTTTYWVRRTDGTPCNLTTSGVTQQVTVTVPSTAPTGISGTFATCGGNTTLTATGGTLATGGVYQWGTGTIGSNIIAGQASVSITVAPNTTTTYWVRRVDVSPCDVPTNAVTATVMVNQTSTAPTSITGTSPLCAGTGGTTLYVNGGSLATNAQYQWGTGAVGTNIIGNNTNSLYINPAVTTSYWVRYYDPACNSYTAAATITVTVASASTSPTGISGINTICLGNSTTLTATGGTHAPGATYAWGIGYTVGQNVIAGQNASTMTVSPTEQTVYWVRRLDAAPCNSQTQGPSIVVNVTSASTAPTAITGAPTTSACAGTSYTLTATGGSAAAGSVYQWGTGNTIGSGVIAGQTGASITVNPTVTTTYWVRRYDGSPCSAYTSGVSTTVAITAPAGTPTAFGANQWNVYGYSTPDITLATAVYAGYYTQNTLSFSTQSGTNSWSNQNSPSSSAGWTGCPIPNDNFTFVYKRTGFPCGTYTIALANWDDQAQVYINGTLVWSCASWSGGGACSGNIAGSFNLSATSNIEIRVREQGGGANLAVNFTKIDVASTAPTAISGQTVSCDGAAVTLTATGGITGSNGSFQWGTGSVVGSSIIAGETSASIVVTPNATTTYWVRRRDNLCGFTTAGVTQIVTIGTGSVAGTLTSESSVLCRNSVPGSITLTGNVGAVIKWQYASNAAFTAGVTDIASTATVLTGSVIGQVPSTRYFRAVVQSGQCGAAYTPPVQITVPSAVTYNGSWSGTPTPLTPVIIASDLTLAANLEVCACQVTNNATVTIQPNVTLVVQREIVVEESSNVTVENNGSIVQIQDDAINMGPITVKRNTQAMKNFDFTYWSSPVQNWTLHSLSPDTRFDKYFSFNPVANQWVTHMHGTAVMEPGRGYTVRAPADWSVSNATQGVYHGSFTGVPNSGIVPVTIAKGAGAFNLIGNPYPSAIDIDLFITDPANANLVNGTIYLWTHNTAVSAAIPGNAQYNYTADDYAKYNLTGGVMTASNAVTGGARPTGKVTSGQGFFIQANNALANGTYSGTFRNSMRVVSENGQFFKNGSQANATPPGLEKHRAWLTITNDNGAYDEMLLGYIEGATNAMDRLYDGPIFNGGNFVSLYSLVGNNKLAIQGRALPFNASDVIPLGYKSSVAGTFAIGLDHFDGLFENQNVYLVDKTDMSYHLLNNGSYSFTTATGIFENRFELRFLADGQLGTGNHLADNSVYIVKVDKHIEVSSGNFAMQSIGIFDLTGKKVFEKDGINTTLFSSRDLNMAAQVLIVKIKLDNDQTITKKVIMY